MEEESQLPRVLDVPPETCWGRDLLGPPEALRPEAVSEKWMDPRGGYPSGYRCVY